MTKRYGRNQKRAHRERIAQLEAALEFQQFSAWKRASDDDFVIPENAVLRRTVAFSDEKLYRVELEERLYLSRFPEGLEDVLFDGGSVSWRGRSWILREIERPPVRIGNHHILTLRAVSDSSSVERGKQLARILGLASDTYLP